MKRLTRFISILLIPVIILFIIYLPRYADTELHRNRFTEWLSREEEAYSGSISIWHVVGFKPYIGSMGTFLKSRAKAVEKKHFGVYIDIEAITLEEAEKRMLDGEFPDAISFPAGFLGSESLRVFTSDEASDFDFLPDLSCGIQDSRLYALPYAASCEFIIYDPGKLDIADINTASVSGSMEEYKKNKVDCFIGDARTAGDLSRAAVAGKGRYFAAASVETETKLVQYLGIGKKCASVKIPYIIELFKSVFTEKAMTELCELGLFPFFAPEKYDYEQEYLLSAYERYRKGEVRFASFSD